MYFPTKTGLCKTYGKIKVQVLSSLTVNRCTFRCMKITKVRSFIVNGKKYLDSLSIVTFHTKIVFEGKKIK